MRIPLLTALPRPPSWFQGGRFAARWNGGEGMEGLGEGEEGKKGKGGSWGNSALVVGGIDAPARGEFKVNVSYCIMIKLDKHSNHN